MRWMVLTILLLLLSACNSPPDPAIVADLLEKHHYGQGKTQFAKLIPGSFRITNDAIGNDNTQRYSGIAHYQVYTITDTHSAIDDRMKKRGYRKLQANEHQQKRRAIGGFITQTIGTFKKGDVFAIEEQFWLVYLPNKQQWKINSTYRAPGGLRKLTTN